jgi:EF-P beta-lysylation protein EpmB
MPAAPCNTDWQTALADAVRDPAELCRLLGLDPLLAAAAERAAGAFPLLVPRTFLSRIRPGDPEDPLLVQVLPHVAELAEVPGFRTDPLGEAGAACSGGLLWKYRGRSLMVTTPRCAVHCRFCFRRHFPFHSAPQVPADWEPALERIAAEDSIHEVILSGGDPLALPDEQLSRLAGRLAEIPHLSRLRLHTRLPVMIPQRVTDRLLAWMRATRLSPVMVIHLNHPAEIDDAVAAALGRLIDAGIPVLNQAVLLRGVNDRIDVLAELCERLVDLRVMPYYLHQLDPVAGAAHFRVPEAAGVRLIEQLRARLPGYAVPRYVRETPGEASKEVLA